MDDDYSIFNGFFTLILGADIIYCAAFAGFNDGMKVFNRQDFAIAIRNFTLLEESNDVGARFGLGKIYSRGNEISRGDKVVVINDYVIKTN